MDLKQVALLVFFAIFVGAVIWILMRPQKEIDREARIPLDDDPANAPQTEDDNDD